MMVQKKQIPSNPNLWLAGTPIIMIHSPQPDLLLSIQRDFSSLEPTLNKMQILKLARALQDPIPFRNYCTWPGPPVPWQTFCPSPQTSPSIWYLRSTSISWVVKGQNKSTCGFLNHRETIGDYRVHIPSFGAFLGGFLSFLKGEPYMYIYIVVPTSIRPKAW